MSRPLFTAIVLAFISIITPGLACNRCAWADVPVEDEPSARPNMVLIITDDHRYDAMSVVQQEQGEQGRYPWIETPNMDRLAREGMRFRNAFVNHSLCSPSRASILTGQYGFYNGVVNNRTDFPVTNITYASLLREAGYRTGYAGKWHMGEQSGHRPGFDYSASYVGQGVYMNCEFEVNGQPTPTEGWVDDVATDFALAFIRENRNTNFVLTLGFKTPHAPNTPPPRLAGHYGKPKTRLVPNLDIPAIFLADEDYDHARPTPPGWGTVFMDYHRTSYGADQNIGRILDELDQLGLAGNTIVVYTSDNGVFQGEHRLGDKRAAYEESIRVPMLIRYPGIVPAGKVEDAMVLNLDLPSTFLDYGGREAPAWMQGRSLRPLLEGTSTEWRDRFLYCYFQEKEYPRIPTKVAVRTPFAKIVTYPEHPEWTELFDLTQDPYEVRNLARDPGAVDLLEKMKDMLNEEIRHTGFHVPPFAVFKAKK